MQGIGPVLDPAEVAARYNAGATIDELRRHYRSSFKRIRDTLRAAGVPVKRGNQGRAAGVPVKRGNQGRPSGDIELAIKTYVAGSTLGAALKAGRVGPPALKRALRERGLERSAAEEKALRRVRAESSLRPPRLDNAEVARRYLAGESLPELGRRYGVSPQAIRYSLHRSGTPVRSRREGQLIRYQSPTGAPAVAPSEE